ncbi:JmjC domain-containing protein [Streptomyces galilaeus]|uniref:JmjC domain-containing protein n=1 Tax=Streptomyces galilaeus TaxID=33899 RepID=A0ABW9J0I6_STRGJ
MLITDDDVEPVLGVGKAELSEAKGRRWLHRSAALQSHDTYSWNDLNTSLRYGNLGPDQVRLVGGDVSVDELFHRSVAGGSRTFLRIVPEAVHRALATGGTLVIDQLDLINPWADQVARALAGIFTTRVQANLYASLRGAPGFGAHKDTHDVFVVQGRGKKHWTLGTGADTAQLTMVAGDVLYLPEGTSHDVATGAEGALHITFAIPRPNVQELLSWTISHSQDTGLLAAIDEGDPAATATALAERTHKISDTDVSAFLQEGLSRGVAPSYVNLPYAVREAEPGGTTTLFARRSFVDILPDEADEHAQVLACLSATDEMAVEDLLSVSGVSKPLDVVRELAQRGLISLSER